MHVHAPLHTAGQHLQDLEGRAGHPTHFGKQHHISRLRGLRQQAPHRPLPPGEAPGRRIYDELQRPEAPGVGIDQHAIALIVHILLIR